MTQKRSKSGGLVVGVLGVLAIISMLVGHKAIEGYVEKTQGNAPDGAAATPTSGVSGRVTYSDGSPAAGASVSISWTDSAGRAGSTPAVAGADGSFVQTKIPEHATVLEVRAARGPIAATAKGSDLAGAGASHGGANLVLAKEFRLAGMVRRAGDRKPVAGAEIELGGARVKAGSDGDFKLDHVPWKALVSGRPVAHLSAEGYAPLAWPLPEDAPPESYGDVTILMEPLR